MPGITTLSPSVIISVPSAKSGGADPGITSVIRPSVTIMTVGPAMPLAGSRIAFPARMILVSAMAGLASIRLAVANNAARIIFISLFQ